MNHNLYTDFKVALLHYFNADNGVTVTTLVIGSAFKYGYTVRVLYDIAYLFCR